MNHTKAFIYISILLAFSLIIFNLQQYRIYFYESDNLFLFDKNWIFNNLFSIGGTVKIISSFITQFFKFTILGSVLISAIYFTIFISTYKLSKSIDNNLKFKYLPCIIPIIFLILCFENSFYGFRGHIAIAICLLITILHIKITQQNQAKALILSILTPITIWLIAGSVTIIFVLSTLAIQILKKEKSINSILSFISLISCGLISYRFGLFTTLEDTFLPIQYYNWPAHYWSAICSWLSIPFVIIINNIVNNKYFRPTISILLIISGLYSFTQIHSAINSRLRHYCYLADNEHWDDIIEMSKRIGNKTYFLSYTNLALAHKNQLLDKMFEFRQQIPTQEIEVKSETVETLRMKSHIYHSWGYVAATQKSAFDAMITTAGGIEPHEALRLIETNKHFEANFVAQKYANILSKTIFYANSAKHSLSKEYNINKCNNNFFEINGLAYDLNEIIKNTPNNNIAKQFYEAYILLTADKKNIIDYANSHNQTNLHTRFQEALTIIVDENECRQLGVTDSIIATFNGIKNGYLPTNYKQTYWYYISSLAQ